MKKRQLMALTLAATMIMGSSVTTFAAAGDKSGDSTITASGDVSYVDTKVYNVVLPTSASTQLVVDPQGITQLENGQVATAEQLASGAGLITCVNTPIVKNLSSIPMKISVEMTAAGDATYVTADNSVNSGDVENVLLYAVPSATDATDEDTYNASTTGIVLTKTAAKAEFILDAAAYNFSKDSSGNVTYEAISGDVGHGTGLKFGGYVNKNADWSAYAGASASKSISMTAKFSFDENIADGEEADTTEGAPYAMKVYSGNKVTVTPMNVVPAFTTGSAVGTISYSKGSGNNELQSIKSIEMDFNGTLFDGYNKVAHWQAATDNGSLVTFDSAYVTTYADNEPTVNEKSAKVTYITVGGATKTANVNVKIR